MAVVCDGGQLFVVLFVLLKSSIFFVLFARRMGTHTKGSMLMKSALG